MVEAARGATETMRLRYDMVSILRELAETGKITQKGCVRLLKGLAKRHDLLLGKESPTWEDIENHKFPDR